MAQRQIVTYVHNCDYCGGVIADDDQTDAVQKLSLQGVEYVIELCPAHRPELTEALSTVESFVSKGQRVGGRKLRSTAGVRPPGTPNRPTSTTSGRSKDELVAIRRFARLKGMKVSDRGRIPAEIIDAYDREGKATIDEYNVFAEKQTTDTPAESLKPRRRKTAAPVAAAESPRRRTTRKANPIVRSPKATATA